MSTAKVQIVNKSESESTQKRGSIAVSTAIRIGHKTKSKMEQLLRQANKDRLGRKVKADVRVIRMHDFRHTFASQLLHGGAPLAEVKELLGHRKLESTMIYLHSMPDRDHGATDRLLGKMGWMKREENVIPISK